MSVTEIMTNHWSQHVQEIIASIHVDGVINTLFSGGAENGQFCWIGDVHEEHINFHSGKFVKGDILLDIQGEKVGGYVVEDLITWTKQVTKSNGPVMFKVVRGEQLTKDLRQYLNTRFQQNSVDHELQQVIRTNLYRRTIPCTTRSARPGEVNGVDYSFLSVDEFLALEKSGSLLESGRYEGNYYGTPRPPKQSMNVPLKTNGQHSLLPKDADGGVGSWQSSLLEENQINTAMNSSLSYAVAGDDDDLPYGWELVEDPRYGVYYIDHINKKTQYERPTEQINDARLLASKADDSRVVDGVSPEQNVATDQMILPVFTKNPEEMEGEFVRTKLVKGPHGLGFTIIGGDQPDMTFLQIKDVVPLGPAYHDGALETGDVLINVNGVNVLGFAHQDILQLFQSMPAGTVVNLEVCRGYPLPFDPNDPNTEIVTTVAVKQFEDSSSSGGGQFNANSPPIPYTMLLQQQSPSSITPNKNNARSMPDLTESAMLSSTNGSRDAGPPQFLCINIMKGAQGFGFTIADSLHGQRVRQIIDRPRCKNLMEGDLLLEINRIGVKDMPHPQVVQLLKNCLHEIEASILVQRGGLPPPSRQVTSPSVTSTYNGNTAAGEIQNDLNKNHNGVARGSRAKASSSDELDDVFVAGSSFETGATSRLAAHIVAISSSRPVQSASSGSDSVTSPASRNSSSSIMAPRPLARDSANWSPENHKRVVISQNEPLPNLQKVRPQESITRLNRSRTPGPDFGRTMSADEQWSDDSELRTQRSKTPTPQQQQGIIGATPNFVPASEYRTVQRPQHAAADLMVGREGMAPGRLLPLAPGHQLANAASDKDENRNLYKSMPDASRSPLFIEKTVVLNRLERGFGFKIIGGTEEGSQVAVGPIVPGGAADLDGRLRSGDELLYVDGVYTVGASHQSVVQLMNRAGTVGHVVLVIRRHGNLPTDVLPSPLGSQMLLTQRGSPGRRTFDVSLARRPDEGFGFVIISSVTQTDTVIDNTNSSEPLENPYPWIGRIIEGTPAHRCGRLAVGDHIVAVNYAQLHHMHHDEIVSLIKQSGYNIVLTVSRDEQLPGTSPVVTAGNMPLMQGIPPPMGEMSRSVEQRFSEGRRSDPRSPPRQLPSIPLPPAADPQKRSNVQPQRMPPDVEKVYTVDLPRGARGFGFSIRGGREFGNMPLFVLSIAEGGPADVDGRLKVGDQIIEINGLIMENATHADAINLIQNGGPIIRLVAKRAGGVVLSQTTGTVGSPGQQAL